MVQMLGVLILALGIGPMFASLDHGDHIDNSVIVLGYVVMRVAMVFQWLRAARQSPSSRAACLSYAGSIAAAQIGWVALIFLHVRPLLFLALAVVLAVLEMAGPVVAENKRPTPWHAHHVAERYSLLAIIALGEGIVGTTAALGAVIQAGGGWTWQVAAVGFAGMGLTFGMWWTYFTMPSAEVLHIFRSAKAFAWGYGHLPVFMSIAATGAGLHIAADCLQQTAGEPADEGAAAHHIDAVTAVLAVVLPVALYIIGLFVIYSRLVGEMDRFHLLLIGGATVFLVLPALLAVGGVALPGVPAGTDAGAGHRRHRIRAGRPCPSSIGHARQAEVIRRLRGCCGRPGNPDQREIVPPASIVLGCAGSIVQTTQENRRVRVNRAPQRTRKRAGSGGDHRLAGDRGRRTASIRPGCSRRRPGPRRNPA